MEVKGPNKTNVMSCRLYLLLLLSILVACKESPKSYIGTYTAVNYTNTKDTIYILKENVYVRKVYDRSGHLALSMKSSWEIANDGITFHSFFLNLDKDIIQYPELLSDTGMDMNVFVEKKLSKTQFCTGYLDNQNCYLKLN
ncbi:hypothetical protein ACTJIJ_09430 [Niabella sp. 22666]|uniref:hypothetical protein n=1 Tax=Niabella sp. 22666 TaxID=3453954 RepID=UPI003F865EBD